ncbi:streptogramin lyase [Paenibacillus endophyticus]|uniref:Streptogramin lyase n=1 Tax=Paenibacillus endophyticus TaxID=1294268 RepID=A0A7W5C725_9BACL|nr:S-layer homology domain-containing protein [Paenibacillus endophyticus]MBB3152372.1 streptogramin lyase [Paenibacillus endophyticus]
MREVGQLFQLAGRNRAAKLALAASLFSYGWAGMGQGIAAAEGMTESYSFERMAPEKAHYFKSITDVAADRSGNVFVTEWNKQEISIFNAEGEKLGELGSMDGADFSPRKLIVSEAGFVYVTDGNAVFKLEVGADYDFTIVEEWNGVEQFGYIASIAVDEATGRVYAADESLNQIWLLEEGDSDFESWTAYATTEEASISFNRLSSISVDASGHLYVAEDGNRILKLSGEGLLLDQWDGDGDEEQASFDTVFIDDIGDIEPDGEGNLYVTDRGNNQIVRFNSEWKAVVVGEEGRRNGQFNSPEAITIANDGSVYVADKYNYRVQKFDSSLGHMDTWGNLGGEAGQFFIPEDIAVDTVGNVFVADQGNNRVQQFNNELSYMQEKGGDSDFLPIGLTVNAAGQIYMTSYGSLIKYDPADESIAVLSNRLGEPRDLAMDREGNVYVANTGGHTVEIFNSAGENVASFAGEPDYSGGFFYFRPQSIAVDSERDIVYVTDSFRVQTFTRTGEPLQVEWAGLGEDDIGYLSDIALDVMGNVYLADSVNNRIRKYAPNGELLESWGETGNQDGAFDGLRGIAVDRFGNVLTTESNNNRLQKFEFLQNQLAGIALSAGTLNEAFEGSRSTYTANVENKVSSISVTPSARQAGARIEVNGELVESGADSAAFALTAGETEAIEIKVTAMDGQVRSYELSVLRAATGDGGTGGDGGDGGDGGTGGDGGDDGDGGDGGDGGTGGDGGDDGDGGDGGTGGDSGTGGDGGSGGTGGTGGVSPNPGSGLLDQTIGGQAGQVILQNAAVHQTAAGVAEIMINSSGVDALLALKPLPTLVTIGVLPGSVEQVNLKLPAAITQLSTQNPEAELELRTSFGTLKLPLLELAKQVDPLTDSIRITIHAFNGASSETKETERVMQLNSAESVGSPLLGLKLEALSADGTVRPLEYQAGYAKLIIELRAGDAEQDLAAVSFMGGMSGSVYGVPASYGEGKAELKLKNGGNYTVWRHVTSFKDGKDAAYAIKAIQALSNKFIVQGMNDRSFLPFGEVTRAQYITMVLRAVGVKLAPVQAAAFIDVKEGQWYADAVMTGYRLGLVNGYEDGSFRPSGVINRQEMVTILFNALKYAGHIEAIPAEEADKWLEGFSDEGEISPWARQAAAYAVKHEWMQGTGEGRLSPAAEANRAQGAVLIYNMMQGLGLISSE